MDVNAEFLNEIRQNAEMGQNTLDKLLEVVTDVPFRQVLQGQFQEYKQIFDDATTQLRTMQAEIQAPGKLQKWQTDMMISLKTARDKTPDHIAEMLMQGNVMGMIQVTRRLKQYENRSTPQVCGLADKLLKTEQQNLEQCRGFLG